ncbi:hypothetical protein BJ138DRAFT_267475 [Hygrophoropsis aurantiaca]|uniref:Uncharacterized protein n=1 Tax=Hygrophoropsis aurantiaca TaxID=72124 RepID=A0ACB8APP3_9AGAM|nr:hypothetical protein BJ138DRAFT_267475 [Hygrophoropsis aurantiaca]
MHRALWISEVIGEICNHLDEDSLTKLARTCRTIYPAALDSLWEELDDFRPVVCCLPDDFWVENDEGIFINRNGLTNEDWEIAAKYTTRVRTLSCYLDSTVNEAELIAFAKMAIYSHENHGTPLFPSLKTLHWCDDHPEYFPLFSIAGASLVDLKIAFTPRSCLDTALFLGGLGSMFPHLKNLQINGLEWKPNSCVALSQGLRHLRWLEVFRCSTLDESAWLNLGQLPNLAEIDVYLSDYALQQLKSLTNTHHPRLFTNLRYIRLDVNDLKLVTEFLELLQVSPVSLDIRLHQHTTMETIVCFMLSLSRCCKHNILQALSIRACPFKNGADDATLEFIHPLFCFRNLRKLELHFPYELSASDVLIQKMTNAWPELQHLELPKACRY